MIEIALAGRPVGKRRVRRGAHGHAYTPERTVRFEDGFSLAAQAAMAGRPIYEGALAVDIVVVLPVPASRSRAFHRAAAAGAPMTTAKPEWDNLARCLDAMDLIVRRDDAQIVLGQVLVVYGVKPVMAVRVTPLAAQPPMPAWADKYAAAAGLFASPRWTDRPGPSIMSADRSEPPERPKPPITRAEVPQPLPTHVSGAMFLARRARAILADARCVGAPRPSTAAGRS